LDFVIYPPAGWKKFDESFEYFIYNSMK